MDNQSEQGMFQRIASPYTLMCAAIDNFINAEYAEEVIRDIEEIERGDKETCEEGAEAYMFWMGRNGVTFEFQYGKNGPEKGGEVTLAQFKFAVRTYLQFCATLRESRLRCRFHKLETLSIRFGCVGLSAVLIE